MTTSITPTPPGWYADPWNVAPQRYWDGAQWTAHLAGAISRSAFSVARSESSRKMARWGMITVAANQILFALTFTLVLTGFAMWTSDFMLSTSADGGGSGPSGLGLALIIIGSMTSIPLQFTPYIGFILFPFWIYRIAQDGAGLGIPARRTPGWAAGGWFIPIVNLWFPYESIADALPADRRPPILRWWLMYLFSWATPFLFGVAAIPFIFVRTPALVFAITFVGLLVTTTIEVLQLRWGFTVADRIHDEQRAIAQERGLLSA